MVNVQWRRLRIAAVEIKGQKPAVILIMIADPLLGPARKESRDFGAILLLVVHIKPKGHSNSGGLKVTEANLKEMCRVIFFYIEGVECPGRAAWACGRGRYDSGI